MIGEIERRFSQETQTLLISFAYLQPDKLREDDCGQCQEHLAYLGNYYKLDVSALTTQYALFKEESHLHSCTSGLAVLQSMRQTGLHRVYCELYKLYRIFATLPITTASCERTFSKLTVVKSKLRSTMSQKRLESLMILFAESDITVNLTYDSVIDSFAVMGPRRMKL